DGGAGADAERPPHGRARLLRRHDGARRAPALQSRAVTTDHRYWVHVPAQYTESEAAALMVFQDGWLYLDPDGEIRAGVVFDDLIEPGEMPVTIGVFVDPCAGQEPRVRRV